MCGICGKLDTNSLCKKCEKKLEKLALWNCDNYENITSNFDEHLYIFYYEGVIRKTILEYKFNDKSYLYKTFANFTKKNKKMCVQIKKYDIIMPVPISRKRNNIRGYNQSTLFARDLANEFKIQFIEKGLIKIKNNLPQSMLTKEERHENTKGVYKINSKNINIIKQKNILLVDDIFTTGSTVNECSRILKEYGVANVGILTIAKI